MSCYYPCKVPCTAPTGHQLSDILWAEIALWHRKLKERVPELGGEFEWSSERFSLATHPQESFAVARTSRPERPEALQGFHSENVLFLMAANPPREEGYFYDSHHRMRERWAALHWDGEDSPLVSRSYIEDMRAKYGVDSPIYQVRVKGNFVTAADGVIPLALCIAAQERDVHRTPGSEIRWGLDVARFGDDSTALAKRAGNVQLERTKEWFGKDLMQTVGILKMEYDAAREKPDAILVDVIGIGAGVVDRGKEIGLPVVGINVAESASADERYARLRDELWFEGREWLERRDCELAADDALVGELTTAKYSILSNGKIKVEGKDEMKKRGVASPNRADAWLLTFARVGVSKQWKPIKYDNRGII